MLPCWFAHKIYFGLQMLRGEPVARALRDVQRTESISLEELMSIQAHRQLQQLRFAIHHVPFYHTAYRNFTASIEKAQSWHDLSDLMYELPVIEKDAVRGEPTNFTAQKNTHFRTYPDRTSGSSGSPLTFPCDQKAWAYRHALMFRCMAAFGVNIGEPYALFFGLHWNKRARLNVKLRDFVFNRLRLSAYEIAKENVDKHLQQLQGFKPTHFLGYPSSIYDFCLMLRDRSISLQHLKLKAIFLTAEPLRAYQRAVIEEVTGSRCVDTYGSAEGGLLATECPYGSLHLTSEATWLQVRNPKEESGEAIVTDMMLRAFPMIRYAMGDDVILKPGVCPCGRPHPMLASIEGRSGDPIILSDGRRLSSHVTGYIFKPLGHLGIIRRYRFVQVPNGNLHLYLVVSELFRDTHLSIIQKECVRAFGPNTPLSIQIVESLPFLANAKHRDFVSLRSTCTNKLPK